MAAYTFLHFSGAVDAVIVHPCQDGTIQLLTCNPDDGAIVEDRYTDEACDSLDDAEHRAAVVHDDAMAPAIDMPIEAQILPSATRFTFAWHPQAFSRAPRLHRTMPTWRNELARWMTLVPAAEAHCSPFGGIAYSLTFTAANDQVILRAETSLPTYTPTADSWMRLRAAIGTISMRVGVARFNNNAVTGGPVDQATPRHFSIAP